MAKRKKQRMRGGSHTHGPFARVARGPSSDRVAELFANASRHHQSHRFSEAEALYRQILDLDPGHYECLHNLGVLAHQTGRNGAAVDLIGKAIALNDLAPNFHNSLGAALAEQGRMDAAAASYRRAIALKPDFAGAHSNLGNALIVQGKLDEAAASYRRAIALKPDSAGAHYTLGNVLKDLGRLDQAAASYQRAIALKPDFTEGHNNLGAILEDQGRLDEAAASYRRAIALKPDGPEASSNLGNVLKAQGRLDEAAAAYHRALALKPDFAEAHNNLGVVLLDQGRLDEAAASYRRAINLKPDYAGAHGGLSKVLERQGRLTESVAGLRRAVELAPHQAEFWLYLGRALSVLGELAPARAAMTRAIELDPHVEEAVHSLVGFQPMNDGSPEAEAVFALVSRLADDLDQLAPGKRPAAMFAMSKALEERGEFDRAFAFMAGANAAVRQSLTFDIAEFERRMIAIAKAFDKHVLEQLKDVGLTSERPIFIVGMARSGTTLIEQIISAHPEVHGAGEIPNLANAIAVNSGAGDSIFTAWAKTMTEADCRAIARTYLDSLPPLAPGQARVTDKNLSNFGLLGLIHLCLPNARIIHCRRDPRDVCLSCYATRFSQGQEYAYDLAELGRYWRAYDGLMSHWRAVLPPGRVLEVPYEAVVEDLETWARRLIAHCGLDWDDACLRFHESNREVYTASLAQVRRPIYADSIGRWRRFAGHLGPLLEALGEPWKDDKRTGSP